MKSARFVFLGLALSSFCAHADPVGMAANVKGNVMVSAGGKKKPLRLLGRVEPGSTVSCGANSSAVIVLFRDGSRFQIGAGKSASIGTANVSGAQKMAALAGPSAGAVALLGSSRVGAVMARPAPEYKRLMLGAPPYLNSPVTRFQWDSTAGAVSYTFTLFDKDDNVVWSTVTSETSVEYPANAPQLREKQPYVWKLCPLGKTGKFLTQYRWGVVTALGNEDARTLDQLSAKLRAQAETTSDNTPLLLLVESYLSYGVVNSALELLDALRDKEDAKKEAGEATADRTPFVEAKNEILDGLSPFARVMAKRPIAPEPTL